MPIRVQCACGKALAAPDAAAGKTVACPGCKQKLQVPAGKANTAAAAKAAAGKPTAGPPAAKATPRPAAAAGGLDDLFDEEGFGKSVAAVCPACRQEMKPGSVLCTKCGYHTQQGVRMTGHMTPGVDISSGDMALQKAASDMAKEKKMQKDLDEGAGMPTWMLGLILTILTGLALIGVLAINFSRAAEQDGTTSTFNAAEIFCLFGGVCCLVVGGFAWLKVVWHAFKEDRTLGLMTAFVPLYIFYFAWTFRAKDKNLKSIITAVIILAVAGLFFLGANSA